MFCKKCGKQLSDDSIFCNYCGAPQCVSVKTGGGETSALRWVSLSFAALYFVSMFMPAVSSMETYTDYPSPPTVVRRLYTLWGISVNSPYESEWILFLLLLLPAILSLALILRFALDAKQANGATLGMSIGLVIVTLALMLLVFSYISTVMWRTIFSFGPYLMLISSIGLVVLELMTIKASRRNKAENARDENASV